TTSDPCKQSTPDRQGPRRPPAPANSFASPASPSPPPPNRRLANGAADFGAPNGAAHPSHGPVPAHHLTARSSPRRQAPGGLHGRPRPGHPSRQPGTLRARPSRTDHHRPPVPWPLPRPDRPLRPPAGHVGSSRRPPPPDRQLPAAVPSSQL